MKYLSTSNFPFASVAITGNTLAHLKRGGSVDIPRLLASIADRRIDFLLPNVQQLSLLGGVSAGSIYRARRTNGNGNGSSRPQQPKFSSVDRLEKLWLTLSADERIALAVRLGPDVLLEIASQAERLAPRPVATEASPFGDLFAEI